jgi:SAM-dependent methyltransferase
MRIGCIPESLLESIGLRTGIVPTFLLESLGGLLLTRQLMAGAKLGIFGLLATEPLRAEDVATRLGTTPGATEKLLSALVGARALVFKEGLFALAPAARRWLDPESASSILDNLLFRYDEWRFTENLEEFVRTGRPLDLHQELPAEAWGRYQRGMRSLAGLSAAEVARRTPVAAGARAMLDIGGSHGFISVSFCRKYPGLSAVVLDLPTAVEQAAPILAQDLVREKLQGRVVHRPGNALTDDLGRNDWDIVFVGQLVHHFDEATNRDLVRRIAQALRPGGVMVLQEVIRPATPGEGGQLGALMDLYFALTSTAGTWSFREMAAWQRGAGLAASAPVRLRTAPGIGLQIARRPT